MGIILEAKNPKEPTIEVMTTKHLEELQEENRNLKAENEGLRNLIGNFYNGIIHTGVEAQKALTLMGQLFSSMQALQAKFLSEVSSSHDVVESLTQGRSFQEILLDEMEKESRRMEESQTPTEPEEQVSMTVDAGAADPHFEMYQQNCKQYALEKSSLPVDHPDYQDYTEALADFQSRFPYQPVGTTLSSEGQAYYEEMKQTEDEGVRLEPMATKPTVPYESLNLNKETEQAPNASFEAVGYEGFPELLGGTIQSSGLGKFIRPNIVLVNGNGWTTEENTGHGQIRNAQYDSVADHLTLVFQNDEDNEPGEVLRLQLSYHPTNGDRLVELSASTISLAGKTKALDELPRQQLINANTIIKSFLDSVPVVYEKQF